MIKGRTWWWKWPVLALCRRPRDCFVRKGLTLLTAPFRAAQARNAARWLLRPLVAPGKLARPLGSGPCDCSRLFLHQSFSRLLRRTSRSVVIGSAAQSIGEGAGMAGKIFINYRRDDEPAFAARVRDALVATFGKSNLFMDMDNLLAGQRFERELAKALAESI